MRPAMATECAGNLRRSGRRNGNYSHSSGKLWRPNEMASVGQQRPACGSHLEDQ